MRGLFFFTLALFLVLTQATNQIEALSFSLKIATDY